MNFINLLVKAQICLINFRCYVIFINMIRQFRLDNYNINYVLLVFLKALNILSNMYL